MNRYPGRGLHGDVVQQLGLRVVRGDYAPGAVIEPELLELELGVSKTVIREALRVLAAKGLVDSRPKRGTFVRSRDRWSLLDSDVMSWRMQADSTDTGFLGDLSEVRGIVEPAAIRLAALRRTPEDLLALEDALESMAAAGRNAEQVIEADLRFHLALLKASHNELLVRMDVVIIEALDVRDRLVHRPGDAWRDPVPNHRLLLDAVRKGDPDEGGRAMEDLLEEADFDLRARLEASALTVAPQLRPTRGSTLAAGPRRRRAKRVDVEKAQ